jgi:hypothetical protein
MTIFAMTILDGHFPMKLPGAFGDSLPGAKPRYSSVSVDLLAEASVYLTNRIRATAFHRDETSVLFAKLQDRAGLDAESVP